MARATNIRAFKESLVAAARGPFFSDWEFQTLFCLERSEVESIANSFSSDTALSGDVALALNNAMNNLLAYPHGQAAAWGQWLSVTPEELQVFF